MSQQVSQHNTSTERRLFEIMLLRRFQGKHSLQRWENTSSPAYQRLNQNAEQLQQFAGCRLRTFRWISLQRFEFAKVSGSIKA
jgi:hypothetical protein